MSIESEITRIQENVTDTYSTLSELGADMPETQNTENLASTATTIKALLYTEQSLTEEQQLQARENIGIDLLTAVDSTSLTATLDPNVIYDFGTLGETDTLDITFNILETPAGTEIYHAKFVAGATDQGLSLVNSDDSDLEIKGTVEFEAGVTYEISMMDNVVIIG